jgi:hypothetical protein
MSEDKSFKITLICTTQKKENIQTSNNKLTNRPEGLL